MWRCIRLGENERPWFSCAGVGSCKVNLVQVLRSHLSSSEVSNCACFLQHALEDAREMLGCRGVTPFVLKSSKWTASWSHPKVVKWTSSHLKEQYVKIIY